MLVNTVVAGRRAIGIGSTDEAPSAAAFPEKLQFYSSKRDDGVSQELFLLILLLPMTATLCGPF